MIETPIYNSPAYVCEMNQLKMIEELSRLPYKIWILLIIVAVLLFIHSFIKNEKYKYIINGIALLGLIASIYILSFFVFKSSEQILNITKWFCIIGSVGIIIDGSIKIYRKRDEYIQMFKEIEPIDKEENK